MTKHNYRTAAAAGRVPVLWRDTRWTLRVVYRRGRRAGSGAAWTRVFELCPKPGNRGAGTRGLRVDMVRPLLAPARPLRWSAAPAPAWRHGHRSGAGLTRRAAGLQSLRSLAALPLGGKPAAFRICYLFDSTQPNAL